MTISSEKGNKHKKQSSHWFHFWSIAAIIILITISHYDNQIGFPWLTSLSSSKYVVDRILYLLPIIYSNLIFGFKGGVISSVAALVLMIPRAFFFLGNHYAFFQILSITATGILLTLWVNSERKHRVFSGMAKESVDRTRDKLRSQIRNSIEQSRRLANFTAFSTLLSQSFEIKEVIKTAIDMVREMMHVEVVLIYSLNEPEQELRLISYEGTSAEFASSVQHIKLGEGFNGRVAQTGQPMLVEDTSTDPRATLPIIKEQGYAQLIVPLISRGKITGTLCVTTPSPHQFDSDEIELLTALGNQIGVAMENSRLYQEQISMTEELRFSEEKYRQLFERAHDAIWVQDLSDKITAINEAGAKLVGYDLNQMIGKDVRQFLSPEGLTLAKEIRLKLIRGEPIKQPYLQRLISRGGSEVVVMLTTNLLTSNGKLSGFQHIARDITKERRLEENLRFYVQQITRAQEEERQRIARELHDSTAQNIIAILHQLENYYQHKTQLPMRDSRLIWNIQEQIKNVLQEIRQFSRDLRPSILDDLGLLPAVEWLTEELKRISKIEGSLTVTGQKQRLSPEVEVTLFRIIQESLRNISRHSGATRAAVAIEFRDRDTVVTISDNGKGFELPKALSELPRTGKLGLVGMEERARLLGGSLNIQSEPGEGTTLNVIIPTEPA